MNGVFGYFCRRGQKYPAPAGAECPFGQSAARVFRACGQSIGLMSVVMLVSAIGVDNFITYIKSGDYKKCILMDAFANGGSVISM